MQGKTHLVWGVTSGLAVATLTGRADLPTYALCAGVGGLAGLVPDWLQINIPGVEQIKGMFGHRGFSHWLWTPLALSIIAKTFYNAPTSLVAAFFCGWASHLALDMLADGIPLLWPFGRLTLAHIKTGSNADSFFGGGALVLGALLLIEQVL